MHFPSKTPTSPGPAPTCCARCGPSCRCSVPHCLDLSLARTSERGLYRAELAPDALPVPLGVPTSWTLLLLGSDECRLDHAQVTVDGGMPQRGDRYPVVPVVTAMESGRYRISGLEFAAPGWWLLRLTIAAPPGTDVVTFNLALE